MAATEQEKTRLYKKVLHRLGAPVRAVELEREQLDSLLEMSIEDYSEKINEWLIESQWSSIYGLNLDNQSVANGLMTRDLDFERSFSYAYSKQAGLGAGGNWELKKDFIELQRNVQTYQIPANREINEVLWYTPATLDQTIVDPFLGVWNQQFGAEYVGLGAYYVMPSFDILLRAQDRNLKNRIIRSEMIYKITGGPNGTKILHLYNTPGGNLDFNSATFHGGRVWYTYYDTADKNRDECLEENPDVVKLPTDVPVDILDYTKLNSPSKTWVRRYFTALTKETLGRTRGKFSGKLKVPDDELTLDYESLLLEGKEEQSEMMETLILRLERLRHDSMLKRKAEEAENLNKSLSYIPMPRGPFYAI